VIAKLPSRQHRLAGIATDQNSDMIDVIWFKGDLKNQSELSNAHLLSQ
jgi:hypothetical protein